MFWFIRDDPFYVPPESTFCKPAFPLDAQGLDCQLFGLLTAPVDIALEQEKVPAAVIQSGKNGKIFAESLLDVKGIEDQLQGNCICDGGAGPSFGPN